MEKRQSGHPAQAAESLTYVGRYGCHEQYFKLKECIEATTAEGKSVGLCDSHYDMIGECILDSFRRTDGKGVQKQV